MIDFVLRYEIGPASKAEGLPPVSLCRWFAEKSPRRPTPASPAIKGRRGRVWEETTKTSGITAPLEADGPETDAPVNELPAAHSLGGVGHVAGEHGGSVTRAAFWVGNVISGQARTNTAPRTARPRRSGTRSSAWRRGLQRSETIQNVECFGRPNRYLVIPTHPPDQEHFGAVVHNIDQISGVAGVNDDIARPEMAGDFKVEGVAHDIPHIAARSASSAARASE